MVMPDRRCRSCHRALHSEATLCPACSADAESANARRLLVIGSLGLPLLLAGMLGPDPRLVFAGGILSGSAVVVYIALLLR